MQLTSLIDILYLYFVAFDILVLCLQLEKSPKLCLPSHSLSAHASALFSLMEDISAILLVGILRPIFGYFLRDEPLVDC
jgi:hypothetical protein